MKAAWNLPGGVVLVPEARDLARYCGFLRHKGRQYSIRLSVRISSCGEAQVVSLDVDESLAAVVRGSAHMSTLQKSVETGSLNPCGVIKEIFHVLEGVSANSKQSSQPNCCWGPSALTRLMQQLETIGWNYVSSIDYSSNQVSISVIDSGHRQHKIRVTVPSDYPESPPSASCDLPGDVSVPVNADLTQLVAAYKIAIEGYQSLWKELDEIDTSTWVLSPPKSAFLVSTTRRIALATHCSLQITIDPAATRGIPTCVFLGPEVLISPLKERFFSRVDSWDVNASVLHNLQRSLDIAFPSQDDASMDDISVECGICCGYELDGTIPNKMCENQACHKSFHESCLREWFKSITTTSKDPSSSAAPVQMGFGSLIFGKCPHCNVRISVKDSH
ncbi:E3 ubiquitin-protein ligase FANCL [Pelomyxa schiedti]|nr:E3 ubiquitin-protein ligase FANCL [Pelomyxa schiedti]